MQFSCGHRGQPNRPEEKRISRLLRKSGFIPMLEEISGKKPDQKTPKKQQPSQRQGLTPIKLQPVANKKSIVHSSDNALLIESGKETNIKVVKPQNGLTPKKSQQPSSIQGMILDVEELDSVPVNCKYASKNIIGSVPEPEMELAAEDSDEENTGVKPIEIVVNEQDKSANTILATSEDDIYRGKHPLKLPIKAEDSIMLNANVEMEGDRPTTSDISKRLTSLENNDHSEIEANQR